jgi:hypothetical protein
MVKAVTWMRALQIRIIRLRREIGRLSQEFPIYTILLIILVGILPLIATWRTWWHRIPEISSKIGDAALNYAHSHPHLGATFQFFLDAIPDAVPLLLALAGLGYCMPDLVKKIESSRPIRVGLMSLFVAFALLVIIVNAINRTTQDRDKDALNNKIGVVQAQNTSILTSLTTEGNGEQKTSEAEKKENILKALRDEYILSHDPIDPDILSGAKMPPDDWLNSRLHDLGQSWTVSGGTSKPRPQTEPRSYLAFLPPPAFGGRTTTGLEGSPIQPGDPLGFNVHFKATGPNPVEFIVAEKGLYLEPNVDLVTQNAMLAAFMKEVTKDRKSSSSPPHTLMPGDSQFISAFVITNVEGPSKVATQDDLDKLRQGEEFAFVIAELIYKDQGVEHHQRMCVFLQPPATPPGIWHDCVVFGKSD